MIDRSQRFIVWLFALFLISPLLYKGHCSRTDTGSAVAFRSLSAGRTIVRVKGDVPKTGIYRLPDGATVGTVINMTMPGQALPGGIEAQLPMVLRPGMVLAVTRKDRKKYALTVSYMKAKERMILGIPLDLRLMNEEDWDALPGIGAKTAKAIIFYRQKYGDFRTIQDLERVPGMSGGKIMKITQFFSD